MADQKKMIQQYLTGKLSSGEKESFEEHMFNCDECYEEIQVREETRFLVKNERHILFADYLQAKAKIEKVTDYSGLVRKSTGFVKNWRRIWAFASIAIAAGILTFVMLTNRTSSDPLTGSYETRPFPYNRLTVRDESARQDDFLEGMDYYVLQDYTTASTKLENAMRTDPDINDVRFYLGVTYYMEGELDKAAETLLEDISKNPNMEKNRWYLGHTYLRQGKISIALEQFKIIAEFGQKTYTSAAHELIEKILAMEPDVR